MTVWPVCPRRTTTRWSCSSSGKNARSRCWRRGVTSRSATPTPASRSRGRRTACTSPPQHLSRLFRHETGVTFVDYLSRVRIRRAVELLADGELKMYEIAERVGYSSQHYFSSAFKKVLGVSPMEYRRGGAAR
ncbi:helix-turn-helix domain-containing protein [Anaerotruncus massiliensis (ex Liu et al. 2021)]|uniref:helix-turn-helix domain-containing protein n=1 Tax=Anaerotruncus massiliensis (ex Liu et al. 2021) TaxID=2321404 RepID=UPI003AB5CACB